MSYLKTYPTPLSISEVVLLNRANLNNSWNGSPSSWRIEASIIKDPYHIFLVGAGFSKAPRVPPNTSATYYEGLWDFEVIEFFFGTDRQQYIEYHVAPNGNWWAHSFIAPRVRSTNFRSPKVEIHREIQVARWITVIKISRGELLADLEGNIETFNIAASFKGETSPYLSLAPLPGDKPNFHQPDKFLPISFDLLS